MLTQRDRVGILVPPLEAEQMEGVGSAPPLGHQVLQRELRMRVQEQWGLLISQVEVELHVQVEQVEVEASQALV